MTRPVAVGLAGRLFVATLLACVSLSCTSLPRGSPGQTQPTATATRPPSVGSICAASATVIGRLDAQLSPATVTGDSLVQQGTIVATLTGTIADDIARLRPFRREGPTQTQAWDDWLGDLQDAVDAGVRAVHASASREEQAFQAALAEMQHARMASHGPAAALDFEACPY